MRQDNLPNVSTMYYVVTRINAQAPTSGLQIAHGIISGDGVTLMRQKVSGSYNTWRRVDAGKRRDSN